MHVQTPTDVTKALQLREGSQHHVGPIDYFLRILGSSFIVPSAVVTISRTSSHFLIFLFLIQENSSNYVQIGYMGGKYFEYLISQKHF